GRPHRAGLALAPPGRAGGRPAPPGRGHHRRRALRPLAPRAERRRRHPGALRAAVLKGRPHIEPRRRADADSVVAKEIYVSLQGESSPRGVLCPSVRLTGCHLGCPYCDSASAFHGGERMRVPAVLDRVRALGARAVEVTGGEPLLQPGVYPLMEALLEDGRTV